MSRASRSITSLTSFALLLASIALSGTSTLGADRHDPGRAVSERRLLAAEEASSLKHWTKERMAAARPMPAPDADRRKPRVTESDDVGRRARLAAGEGVQNEMEGKVITAAEQPSMTYPFPFTRRPLEKQLRRVRPYVAVGRVFFTQGGVDYVCTGASVASKPRQVVLTAGHCLNDGLGAAASNWSKNVVFVPGWWNTKGPYGRFPAKVLWAPQGWTLDGDYSFDLGAFSVGKNSAGRRLQYLVGAFGFAYNQVRSQHWVILGYPATPPFSGKRLQMCEASRAIDDAATGVGPDTIGLGCDMQGGASGAPWIKDLRRGSYINGLVSYGYAAQPAAVYGPYFDLTANDLRCAAATGRVAQDSGPDAHFDASCQLPS